MTSKPNRAMIDADIEWMNKMVMEGDEELANMDTELLRREEATARANKDAAYLAETARNIREYNASSKSKKADVVGGTYELPPKDRFVVGDKTPKFDHNGFSKWLIEESDNYFATMLDTNDIYQYEDGIYVTGGVASINQTCEKIMDGDLMTIRNRNEVAGHVRALTTVKRDDFDENQNIINMANGLYDVDFGIKPHTPKYLSLHKSPIVFDPDATCPAIDTFIEEVVEPDRIQTIYEIGGYAIAQHKNLKTAFIFNGEKNSGKSAMVKLLEATIDPKATTHVSPLTVSRTTYGAAEYYGKQLNIVDDLGNSPIEDTGVLKSVIGGGRISAKFLYGQPFDYTPNVLCIFATNEVPTTTTADDAFNSRFSIIEFPNLFEGDDANPDLVASLITPPELSGFFNKCMDAYDGLVERQSFTGDGTLADRITAYEYSSKPVVRFIDECCVTNDPEDNISKDELYGAYINWSREHGYKSVDKPTAMTSYLKPLGCVVRRITGDDENRYYAYCGITLKSAF